MANRRRLLFIVALSGLMASCQSAPKVSAPKELTFQDVAKLPVGAPRDLITQTLGRPAREIVLPEKNEILWHYPNPINGDDRVILTIDADRKKLAYKLILPSSSEPEINLDYDLKDKFKGNEFLKVSFPQCGLDFVSDDILYIDASHAVIIRASKTTGKVLGISWTYAQAAEQTIRDVKNCKHR